VRALTIWEPYASLIALGHKQVETRGWATSQRGLVAIHASHKRTAVHERAHAWAQDVLRRHERRRLPDLDEMPWGSLVAIAELVYCIEISEDHYHLFPELEHELGDIGEGRWAWVLQNVRPLTHPLRCRGGVGFWPLTDEQEQRLWNVVDRDKRYHGDYAPRRQRRRPGEPAPGQLMLDLWGVKEAAEAQALAHQARVASNGRRAAGV
jgi:activating signal cointegrator 1